MKDTMSLLANIPELAAQARASLRRGTRSSPQPAPPQQEPRSLAEQLQARLHLPMAGEPPEESTRVRVQDRGQFLARQERWEELSRLIRSADNRKAATHCGMPHANLLSLGARTDVVMATEHAIADGFTPKLSGIEELEDVLAEFPEDYAIAAIVAQAHMDIGWAWRGSNWSHEIPARNLALFQAHFDRAAEILESFARTALASPLLAAAHCALVVAKPKPALHIADAYARLIDLNPVNTAPMRSLGNFLLPRWFGSYDVLELEARRMAARTSASWGNGGYTWVFLDALRVDHGVARNLDVSFFIDGLKDILYLQPDQHIANLLAAYTGITMSPARTPPSAPDIVRDVRKSIHACFDGILRESLHELHPLLWAEAELGPNPGTHLPPRSALLRRGRDTAFNAIASHFHRDLQNGKTLEFGKTGLTLFPQG
ncbi:hypothetical protein [uncultured Lentibacter sp.]|uniref:hypothetical protein n=1 Tax=uncultured Lentibacter sp. TaxID=1659309 RepID=UPI0026073906|nr:hypothetical protein [uncultured Lentibacter sp.]